MTARGSWPARRSPRVEVSPPGGTRTAMCHASASSNSSSCCCGRASRECSSRLLPADPVHAPTQAVHPPARVGPPVDVEAITAVHNDFGAHRAGKVVGIELDELAPFGQYQHGVGAITGLHDRRRVI